jgi:sugar phosphate permease
MCSASQRSERPQWAHWVTVSAAKICSGSFAMIAAAVYMLLNARQVPMLVLWLIVVGIAGAAPVALVPMVTTETLGLKRFGTLFGCLGSVVTVGLFIGPVVVEWMTDVTGSYTTPFELCALICRVGPAASFLPAWLLQDNP